VKCWISHVRHLEWFAADAETLIDAWTDGGVDGLVIGPAVFGAADLLAHSRGRETYRRADHARAAFDPDPRWYRELGVAVPAAPAGDDTDLRRSLRAALARARERGLEVWVFDPLAGADGPDLSDNAARIAGRAARPALIARMLDTIAAFPEATGFVVDGPAWGFEITELEVDMLRTRRRLLELPSDPADCTAVGHDAEHLRGVERHLQATLQNLTTDRIAAAHDAMSSGGDGALALFGAGYRDWLRFRCDALTDLYQHMAGAIDEHLGGRAALAVCPRTIALGPVAGYDYRRVAGAVDVVMPKLYFWQRGYDGLVGTAFRWATTLRRWNPVLTVADACRATRAIFGASMPLVETLLDFDRILTADYVGSLTRAELGRTVAAVGDRARVVPWIDTGRAPHDGDPMPPALLEAILVGCRESGVDTFTYFNSGNMSTGEWTMVSELCGQRWEPERTPGWQPPDRPTL
jgi:hypothetical protein